MYIPMTRKTLPAFPLALLLAAASAGAMPPTAAAVAPLAGATPPKPAPAPAPNPLETTAEGQAALKAWEQEGHAWTPKARAAYLAFAKAQALNEIAAAGQAADFPADFLAFVDGDPQVALTIYGFQPTGAANRLRLLRSLELDLGKEAVRGKYKQLALAMAVVRGNAEGAKADLKAREPMKLVIPGDPRVIVDTKPKDRPLDVNDHIINFLNDHAPIPDDGRMNRVSWPELAYDANGKAIGADKVQPKDVAPAAPAKDGAAAPKMRRIMACDVIASAALEKEFNDYMAARGQSVRVDCGMPDNGPRLNWRSNDVKGVNSRGITAAYHLFLGAYRAKGYFPPVNADKAPSAAESLAYYRMIGDYQAPLEAKIKGPRFDFIKAPWPILVYLAQDDQPLRVRDDMWRRYLASGEFHGYGEYTGPIAQAPVLQQARRATPYAFDNGTLQMMIKDGGVCGTMANMCVRNSQILGAPASTAGQPGHCALVRIVGGPGNYGLAGGQYATGGDGSTTPHRPFIFGGAVNRQMPAHQSVAFAVNAGTESFLDTLAARSFHQTLPAEARATHGLKLLISAIALNPYSLAVNEDALAAAGTPVQLAAVGKALNDSFANLKDKPGCPPVSHMRNILNNNLYAKLEKMPVPATAAEAAQVLAFLRLNGSPNIKLNINYTLAGEGEAGIRPLLEKLQADFQVHAARRLPGGPGMPNNCAALAVRVAGLVESDCPDALKQPCLDALRGMIKGHENYTYRKIEGGAVIYTAVDPSATVLAKAAVDSRIAKAGLPAFTAETEVAFKSHVLAERTDASCAIMADTLTTILGQWADKKQRQAWAAARLKESEGHEKFFAGSGTSVAVTTDPAVPLLAKHAGAKTRSEQEMTQSLRDGLAASLKQRVASERPLRNGGDLVARLAAAAATIKEPEAQAAWLKGVVSIIPDQEKAAVTAPGKPPQAARDPVADSVIAQGIRAAGRRGDQPAFAAWTALADKLLPPVAPGDVFLNPQQAAAHPKMEPFSGALLSSEGLLRASSACKHDRPLSYKDILRPGLGGWLHTNPEAKPWLQVDLPADSEISGIVLVGRYEHPKDNPNRTGALPMKVLVSVDGKTWTDAATIETVQDVYRVDLENSKPKARHIRVERAPADKQPAGDFQFRNVLVYGRKSS